MAHWGMSYEASAFSTIKNHHKLPIVRPWRWLVQSRAVSRYMSAFLQESLVFSQHVLPRKAVARPTVSLYMFELSIAFSKCAGARSFAKPPVKLEDSNAYRWWCDGCSGQDML